jgi:hypothetical protein
MEFSGKLVSRGIHNYVAYMETFTLSVALAAATISRETTKFGKIFYMSTIIWRVLVHVAEVILLQIIGANQEKLR